MEIQLTWDIVFIAIFIVIFGVAFIRPHKFTLRLLLGTYLSLIVTESSAFFLEKIVFPASPALQIWISERTITAFVVIKLMLFSIAIILFLIRGHYHIEHKKHDHYLARSITHFSFAVLTSLLLSLSFFAFLSGSSLIEVLLGGVLQNSWFDDSFFIGPILHYFGIWFALPAIGMLIASIFSPKE